MVRRRKDRVGRAWRGPVWRTADVLHGLVLGDVLCQRLDDNAELNLVVQLCHCFRDLVGRGSGWWRVGCPWLLF